jgi:hypothetical protein
MEMRWLLRLQLQLTLIPRVLHSDNTEGFTAPTMMILNAFLSGLG